MKSIYAILLLLFINFSTGNAQNNKVKGTISTDTADLKILGVYPDMFPNVSVLFKAETRKGEPVWNLSKEKMKVKENEEDCKVVSLEQISKLKALNIGIVIDHSGSMQSDAYLTFDNHGNYNYPKGGKAPIDNAKLSVKSFIKSFNSKKDLISVIGFSEKVDRQLPLTKDTALLNATVDSMKADFSTALYDAMIAGIDEIKSANGVKVLVVLTDGLDNSSINSWKSVIAKSTKENIPIYIIGLGNVNIDTLQLIAKSTKGHFYYTQTSSSLDTMYALISKQVQAFYELVYTSPNYSSTDSSRNVEVSFDIDSLYLETNSLTQNFPVEVVAKIEKKERQREYLFYGGILGAILLVAGTLLFYYKNKPKSKVINQPVIKKLFPNPSTGNINLDYESMPGQLSIININGQPVKTIDITGYEKQFDLSGIGNGNFIAIIHTGSLQSNAVKFTIQH